MPNRTWILYICLPIVTICQIIYSPRAQPSPIISPFISKCCASQDLPTDLFSCAQESINISASKNVNTEVALVSYVSPGAGHHGIPDIIKFGAYAVSIVAAYTEHNNYIYQIFSNSTGK